MKRVSALLLALAALPVVAAAPAALPAAPSFLYRDGPPPGFTGGFGEQSCHACHFAADLNEAPGAIWIEGAPESYRAGETYPLNVTLTRPGMKVGGFQLAARYAAEGVQAGVLNVPEEQAGRLTVVADREIQYAYQLRPGTEPGARDTIRWTVLWTAPESGGAVAFHVAGNAGDGDDSIDGDVVYTAEHSAAPARD